jgi:tetratricopeptide (TPR) repeat protein
MADSWFAQGEASMKAGNPAAAVAEYRNALVYSPEKPLYQLHLAQALVAMGDHDAQAQSYLQVLWVQSPGSGEINLELARIAARRGDGLNDVLRYYHSAIDGEWNGNPVATRWQVRRELCEYLLANGQMPQARIEVTALADNTPADDSVRQLALGQMLVKIQDWTRAQTIFRTLLASDRTNPGYLLGAGTVAFQLGQFAMAREYFDKLPPDLRSTPDTAKMVDVSHQVLAANPYLAGLSTADRARRAENAIAAVRARAQSCIQTRSRTPHSIAVEGALTKMQLNLDQFQRMQKDWNAQNLGSFPDRLDAAMAAVFDTESAATVACGEPAGPDRALWLLGKSRAGQTN